MTKQKEGMTIDEAIKIKLQWRKDNYPIPLADEMNADMLSFEALKRIKWHKEQHKKGYYELLPGETEE
jgi:hypothetical protein